jgi:hypothetical protein
MIISLYETPVSYNEIIGGIELSKVLIVGLGDVGAHLLEFLVRDPNCPELLVGDFNEEKELTVNNALIGAAVKGLYPKVTFKKMDLTDVKQTTEIINQFKPEVIIQGAVMHTWHLIRKLPEEVYAKISSATLGAWLPAQTALAYHLMLALKESNVNAHVVNTSLSCLVNPALASVGLAPAIGIGNVELMQPAVKIKVSRLLNVPPTDVKVSLIAHHNWWVYPREAGYVKSPFIMKIYLKGQDISDEFDLEELLYDSIKLYPAGIDFTTVSATSAIENMYALLSDEVVEKHSPGPMGLPGGYPIKISKKGAEVNLPEGVTLEEAIAVNIASQKNDGIEEIREGGTIVFTDIAHKIMKEMLDFDYPEYNIKDSLEVAKELISKYHAFAKKYE